MKVKSNWYFNNEKRRFTVRAFSMFGPIVLLAIFIGGIRSASADQTITVDCSKVLFTNDTVYHGVNYCAFWDDAQGSLGSRAALRRAGVQIIRFPGGEPANYLDWSQKTTWTTTSTDSLITYAVGVGARLMLGTNPTVNKISDAGSLNDSSAKHAADWLSYCMARGDTVPFWEIGNEPESGNNWAQADWDSTKLKWYYERFNAHSAAIKALNPKVKCLGPVAANTWYWWGVHDLPMFLKYCDKNCDAISLHWYPVEQQYPGWDNIKAAAQGWQSCMDYIRTVTQKPVYITEWSAHGSNAGSLQMAIALALTSSDIIGAFAKSGVAGHTWFGTIHNVNGAQWGIMYGAGEAKAADTPVPSYFTLPLWTKMGNQVLGLTNTGNASDNLSAYAHKKTNGSVQVMLINKTAQQSVTVGFKSFDPSGKSVRIYELRPATAGNVWDTSVYYNEILNPNASKVDLPGPLSATCASAIFTRVLPAYSITVLDFTGSNTVINLSQDVHTASFGSLHCKVLSLSKSELVRRRIASSNTFEVFDTKGRRIGTERIAAKMSAGVYIVKENNVLERR